MRQADPGRECAGTIGWRRRAGQHLRRWLAALTLVAGSAFATAVNAEVTNQLDVIFPTRYDPAVLGQIWFDPFTEQTDTQINAFYTQTSTSQLLAASNGQAPVDVIFLSEIDAFSACREGRLLRFEHELLTAAPNGDSIADDFLDGGLPPCGVNVFARATVVAFNLDVFLGERPDSIQSFFDVQNFPGLRAVSSTPDSIMEWALLSYRVPREALYQLLSTERGLKLVFNRLDAISEHTLWCDDPSTPTKLLLESNVVMAAGFADSFFDAKTHGQQNIEIIWDGQIIDMEQVAIPATSEKASSGYQFIRHISESPRLRDYAQRRLVGPMRRSSVELVRIHTPSEADIHSQIPTSPENLSRAVFRDVEWYANTRQRLYSLFQQWFAKRPRKTC